MSSIGKIFKQYHKKIAQLDLELILENTLKKPRSFIIAHSEKTIKNYELRITNKMIGRKVEGEPLAYILGYKEFYGLNFRVNKNVLVPRPETELLVEETLKELTTDNRQPTTIIDIGTGSGCIIITLAKLLNSQLSINNYQLLGIDISKKALGVARQNAKSHKVERKIKFIHGNLLEPILKNPEFVIRHSKFVIVSNLPYLTPIQMKKSPSIKYEPRLALEAGKDGLKYYRQLLKQIKKLSAVNYQLSVINREKVVGAKAIFKRVNS